MRHRTVGIVGFFAAVAAAACARAQDTGVEFFEKKIRPLLVEHCYKCHSAGAKKVRGGLLLDSRPAVRRGGESGPALVPGQPDKSLLIKAVRYGDDALKMPPRGKLPAAAIADLETWVKLGAPDPRDKEAARDQAAAAKSDRGWADLLRDRRTWWSLQPVRNPPVPQPRNGSWAGNAIDHFLLAKLDEKGLTPARAADPRALMRRLSLVLTGLPPPPEQVEAFVRACGQVAPGQPLPRAAVASLVDALLASPHFGEHWARHWMDVVRFTETHGNEWNYEVHHAWRYRDYLIRAFNDDVPYDQLIREHLAGDLLPRPRWNRQERLNESVIGTAFYRFGEVNHDDCITLRQIGYDLADNQIDTLSKAFQALTIACARCHDHKLDAVSMRDYYGLLGVLRSARQVSHTIDSPEVNAAIQERMRGTKQAIRREIADVWLRETGPMVSVLLGGSGPPEKGSAEKASDPLEDPVGAWRALVAGQKQDKMAFPIVWKKIADKIASEASEHAAFNKKHFTVLADFRQVAWPNWQVGGQGLRRMPSRSGDFVVALQGERAVATILPAGAFTHVLSDKLNGTLRSPVLTREPTRDKKWISFQVMGQRSSAVRLVSNNCQLNYANFRALTSPALRWITFAIPEDAASLRTYAELMTMFDNPKFPDQLGQLGGDKMDYRIPWEQAAANPRSFFGVTRVVLHDSPAPPQSDLSSVRALFAEPAPASMAEAAERWANRLAAAVRAWRDDLASDDDARWLQSFLERGLLGNACNLTPRLKALVAEYRRLDGELALPRIIPGVADCGPGFEQPIFVRGDCWRPGETVPRRYIEVLSPSALTPAGSGRMELANLIASRENPLTARVMVNRIWHHLFGAGLVRSVDDFGHVGEMPSHPKLLDHLASRFMEDGWSIKRLIRAIVLTRSFALSHEPPASALQIDPNNRLLAHYPARRMEAESIRDAVLATSGRLDRKLFGMSISAYREVDNEYRRLFRGPLDGHGRRSIYIKVTLMESPKFLEAFDLPGGKVAQGRRDVTNAPAQALAMLNDPFVLQQAEVWGGRLVKGEQHSVRGRIELMFRTALGREPTDEESDRFTRFVSEVAALHQISAAGVLASPVVWRDVAHGFFNLQEFISIP
jgi:hypothetical protein